MSTPVEKSTQHSIYVDPSVTDASSFAQAYAMLAGDHPQIIRTHDQTTLHALLWHDAVRQIKERGVVAVRHLPTASTAT
jgi:hypothetical protein